MASFSWPPQNAFGSLVLDGSTSGALTITVPAVVTSYTLTLPVSQGSAGTVLQNDGSGNLSWVSSGSALTIGAIDGQAGVANGLQIVTGALYAQSASATVPGMVNLTTQSFAGNKTFLGSITGTSATLSAALQSATSSVGASLVANTQSSWTSPTTVPGTCTNSASGTAVTGTNTHFLTEFHIGDTITMNSETQTITAITSDTALATTTWTGANTNATATRAAVAGYFIYPNGNIQVGGSRSTYASANSNKGILLAYSAASTGATTSPIPQIAIYAYSGIVATGPSYTTQHSRGTEASPAVLSSADTVGTLAFSSYGNGAFGTSASIVTTATETMTTSRGTKMTLNVTPNGNAGVSTALTLDQDLSATFGGSIKNGVAGNEFAGSNQTVLMGGADGPAGVTLAKISGPTKWLKILDSSGTAAYIPIYQ